MCGIVGIKRKAKQICPENLGEAVQKLHHRGPDEQSQWISGDKTVGLGHARLSIIDVKGGQQPLASEDGEVIAVVNGEFYDFERIKAELEARGHRFKTNSDSEILVHLYQEKGTACLKELRGEFSFLLWDNKEQRIFAARDRFGIRPLYYAKKDDGIYFASELKALFALGIEAIWDKESIYNLHAGLAMDCEKSLFKNISQLAPGNFVVADDRNFRSVSYWDFDYPLEGEEFKESPEELIKEFRRLFDDSVEKRLRADVEVGVYLSGGIDSCSVLGVGQKLSSKKLKAFTLSFDDQAYDEAKIAERMAAKAGAEFFPISLKSEDLADQFQSAIEHAETIFVNTHGVAKYVLSRYVRDAGIKVVMTGEGSDEILAGYPVFRQDLIQQLPEKEKLQMLNELNQANKVSRGIVAAEEFIDVPFVEKRVGFCPSFLMSNFRAGQKMKGLMNPEYFSSMNHDAISLILDRLPINREVTGRHPVNQSLYLWSKTNFPNYILSVLADRMEMAHSVEGRPVFLDHPLVEFATKLPVDLKIKGLTEKYILREAMKDVLTEEVYTRQKHPFLAPPAAVDLDSKLFQFYEAQFSKMKEYAPFYNSEIYGGLIQGISKMPAEQRAPLDQLLSITVSLITLGETFNVKSE